MDLPSGADMEADSDTHTKLIRDSPQSVSRENVSTKRGIFAQFIVTSAVMLSALSLGMPVGYSAILLPQLHAENGTLQIDDGIASWIASVHSVATPIGSMLSGVLMERCGRKVAVQIAIVPLIFGWMMIGLASNHLLIIIGRIVAGLSTGMCVVPGQVLIAEISEPHIRGVFTSCPFASYSFGILVVYTLGTFLEWRLVAGLCTILPIFTFFMFFFLPESPFWLIRKGRDDDAKKALEFLKGGDAVQAKQEYIQLVSRIANTNVNNSTDDEQPSSLRLLLQSPCLKPFIILNVFNLIQILSGTYLIVFYAVDIVHNLANTEIDGFLAAVLTAAVRFIFTVLASALLSVINRRTLALTSCMGSGIATLCLGCFLYLQDGCTNAGYFAALCLLIFVATNTIGLLILPGILVAELYPLRVRGFAGAISQTIFNVSLFGTTKMFHHFRMLIGLEGIFWCLGGFSFLGCIFIYLMLPETKNRSLNEIEDYFAQSNYCWITREKQECCCDKTLVKTVKHTPV